ncbi:MAG TPA: phenylalanine--tRNA ligase subunit alpha [Candidatus Marinimicrobia bacterium]|nr:phenylalanine--tRNA ligase subunit alpha [Candidatus Neomarinimicrobiota bacterium]|tara:strand:+ start:5123 stop:6112 length:990 start_codon:yes stop_codon:yes gene_type:complete
MSLDKSIKEIKTSFRLDLSNCKTLTDLENLRIAYLGRKGKITLLFDDFAKLSGSEKPKYGKALNVLKTDLTAAFNKKSNILSPNQGKSSDNSTDFSLPGYNLPKGSLHPLEQVTNEIKSIFQSIGFSVAYGPEIDDDYHNFEALNVPKHHPARDMQDTFFIDPNTVLRTHTSNVQIHLMENQDPPIRHICCGRVFRNEAVSYKSFCLFNQVEGLVVNESSSFAEMKGTLEYFVQEMFGKDTKMRFRPSYFPFTEPSAEVDIWNDKLNQWMEILGCGMVNPNVLKNVGYDNTKYQGFAFGLGIERIAMIKYGVKDIRLFYQNDKRFLEQF